MFIRIVIFGLCCLPVTAQAESWFTDPETGCKVYGEHQQPIVTVYWDGDCVDGVANGAGQLRVHIDEIPFCTFDGTLINGKAQGHGVLISPDNSRYEGEFRDNKMHGHGAIISIDGKKLEGNYEQGMPHGLMIISAPGKEPVEVEFHQGRRVR